jgi:protein O-GlcNAc transferase
VSLRIDAAATALGSGLVDVAAAEIATARLETPDLTAVAAIAELGARAPQDASWLLALGRLAAKLGETAAASGLVRRAVTLRPADPQAWMMLAILAGDRLDVAEAFLAEGLAANPDDPRLAEGKVLTLRNLGQGRRAEAYLQSLLPRLEALAWVHFHLGDLSPDAAQGLKHLRRAYELDPNLHHLTLLAQALARLRGEGEGAALDEAYRLALTALQGAEPLNPGHRKILFEVFGQVCAYEARARLGDPRTLGRSWAQSGRHTALMRLLPLVRSREDRLDLLEQHLICGRAMAAQAQAQPIQAPPARPSPRAPGERLRIGFMSSDLRHHPVSFFSLPLFDHLDRSRFDVFCYSYFRGREDALQARIASQVTAFRWMPEIGARQAAQTIADDGLDMLIELGGSTAMNRLEVMAWRPAPLQASWLGYPHSAGLAAIDRLVCDPHTLPAYPALLSERPLIMPQTWVAFGEAVFEGHPDIAPGLPEDRAGVLSFGTASAPYKFTPDLLAAWARVTASVPGARFVFVRPEAGAAAFRDHVEAAFAAEGVAAERLVFHPVRRAHMALYNEIDISLDTFPLTGGTTTAEALWMGVPVVSLRGPAFYERLSSSILANAGLPDLVADDLDGFARIARELAADRPRRLALRRGLRDQIRQGPLGRTEDFARDFYEMAASAIAGER